MFASVHGFLGAILAIRARNGVSYFVVFPIVSPPTTYSSRRQAPPHSVQYITLIGLVHHLSSRLFRSNGTRSHKSLVGPLSLCRPLSLVGTMIPVGMRFVFLLRCAVLISVWCDYGTGGHAHSLFFFFHGGQLHCRWQARLGLDSVGRSTLLAAAAAPLAARREAGWHSDAVSTQRSICWACPCLGARPGGQGGRGIGGKRWLVHVCGPLGRGAHPGRPAAGCATSCRLVAAAALVERCQRAWHGWPGGGGMGTKSRARSLRCLPQRIAAPRNKRRIRVGGGHCATMRRLPVRQPVRERAGCCQRRAT